ncbi:unnamed protein product, partial [Symbiodinium pilosum]
VVVELRGAWEHGDELLLGLWPQDTDLSELFAFPGPQPDGAASTEPLAPSAAPGVWVS